MEKLLKQRIEMIAQEVDKLKAGGAGEGYTKAEADEKFLSKSEATTDYQTKISDLPSIRSGAAAGARALPVVVEMLNNGPKNLCPNTAESGDIYTVNADGTILANGSVGATPKEIILGEFDLKANTTYRMYSYATPSANLFMGLVRVDTSSTIYTEYQTPIFTPTNDLRVKAYIRAQNVNLDNILLKPMVCTKADWDLDNGYAPYRPSYQELYEMVLALQTTRTATTRKTTKTKTNEE